MSEVANLKVTDIEIARMLIWVEQGRRFASPYRLRRYSALKPSTALRIGSDPQGLRLKEHSAVRATMQRRMTRIRVALLVLAASFLELEHVSNI